MPKKGRLHQSSNCVLSVFQSVMRCLSCPCRSKYKRYCAYVLTLFIICATLYHRYNKWFQRANVVNPCTLSKLDFYDKSLDKIFKNTPTEKCDFMKDLIYFDAKGMLHIDHGAMKIYGYAKLSCRYSEVEITDINNADLIKQTPLTSSSYPQSDFVHVECLNADEKIVYSNFLYKINNETAGRHKLGQASNDQLNIIILGLDSTSRLVAERKIPKTLAYIREELGAYVMKGYTKVGDNTMPNLIAMLTGKTIMEYLVNLPSFDYPQFYKDVIAKGYIECHSEDWAYWWPSFGFKYPMYTHYTRTLFLAKEKRNIFMQSPSGVHTSYSPVCFGNKLQHRVLIDYINKFLDNYSSKLKYIFMWQNELGHHNSNKLQYIDEDLKALIKRLKVTNELEKSLVIICGDHGPRYGPVLESDIGRFTGRLPLMAVLVPDQLKKRFPHIDQNMLLNTERLTSPFDIYETLNDILFQRFEQSSIKCNNGVPPRGISLFKSIPKNRSCFDAGISEHYCPCYSFTNVRVDITPVKVVANYVVQSMNKLLEEEHTKCANLELLKIKSAKVQHAPKTGESTSSSTNYVVVLQTIPGEGVFEATAQYFSGSEIKLLGDINRLNAYGNQSSCIENHLLHLYCYCRR